MIKKEDEITAFILAGGKSTRMGKDKGLMMLGDRPMIRHLIDKLEMLFDNLIIIANSKEYGSFGKTVYSDLVLNAGPAGGIYTGLTLSHTELNFFSSCDTPLISPEKIRLICNTAKSKRTSVTVPSDGERVHPLCGVYHRSLASSISKAIELDQYSLNSIVKNTDHTIIEMYGDGGHFFNINTQAEHQNAENILSKWHLQ